jgi:F420-0:gamma-glutamyl ligase
MPRAEPCTRSVCVEHPTKGNKKGASIVREIYQSATVTVAVVAAVASVAAVAVVTVAAGIDQQQQDECLSYLIPPVDKASRASRRPAQQSAHGPQIAIIGGTSQPLQKGAQDMEHSA